MSQSALPWMHWSMLQTPALHAGTPLKTPHVLPQAPQFLMSASTADSHPLEAMASQSAKPLSQVMLHEPALQFATECGPSGQARAQLPHALGLLARFASHPFFPSPSQSPKPGLHVSTAHPALTQAAVPLAMLHVPPHVPQLRRSLRRSVSQPFSARLSQSPNPTLHANVH